jgi:hypothetical protein
MKKEKVSLHPNWDKMSQEKKELFCAAFGIDMEGNVLEGEALNGLNQNYKTISGPGFMMVYKSEPEK